MAAIVAYGDFLRFGVLPRAGGTFDQPGELMIEFRLVRDTAAPIAEAKAERDAKQR
jgi:hypothetical protein